MKKDLAGAQGLQTKCIHAAREFNRTSAISPPIWQTTTFLAESSEHFAVLAKSVKPSEYYSRYGNPTHEQVEAVMATLEGGEAAMVTASGMGAISTSVMSLLNSGDHVVAQRRPSLPAVAGVLHRAQQRQCPPRGDEQAIGSRMLQRQQVRRPRAVADGVAPRAKNARHELVRIVAVAPAHELDAVDAGSALGGGPFEVRNDKHGIASQREEQQRQPLQRRRIVTDEVYEIGARRNEQTGQLRVLGGSEHARSPFRVPVHSFNRIGCGMTSKVAGVVPRTSPSASIGSGRSASITSSRFTRNSST